MFKYRKGLFISLLIGLTLISSFVEAVVPDAPGSYVGVTKLSSTSVRISTKDNSNNEDGFYASVYDYASSTLVQRKEISASNDSTVYADFTDLLCDKVYMANVLAFNVDGNSSLSDTRNFNIHSTFSTPCSTVSRDVPSAPGSYIGVTGISKTSVRVNFLDNSDNEDGFVLFDESGDINVTIPANNATAPSQTYVTLTGLTCDKTYTIKALAFNENGNSEMSDLQAFNIYSTFGVSCGNPLPDTTKPVITLLGNTPVTLTVGASYTDAGATAIDDVDGNITSNIQVTGLPIDTSSEGNHTITYLVSDSAGNEANVTRIVNVIPIVIVDNTPPVITLNGNQNISITKGDTYNELGATAIDDIDGNVSVTVSGEVDTSTVGTYTITYTAVDSSGNRTTLSRTVNVIEPVVKYGVNIGEVQGNTATYHNIARFSVSLRSKPEANVSIPISSSDINEGKVISLDGDASKLIFTTDNWNMPQTVLIEGQNQNVVDGIQNYTIVLDSIISDDANYDGINPNDVEMKGLVLTLTKPIDTTNFIATLPKIMCLKTTYNGREDLTYSLTQNPDGMTINDDGCIVWTAPLSEEGSTHTVSIEASNGSKTQTISFDIHVSQTEVLQSETNNSLVFIIDPNTTLNGVKFRFLGNNPTIPTIKKVENQGLVTIPNGIQVLSDYFYADENNTDDVEVLIPVSMLNDIHDFPRLSLYYMAKHEISAKPIWNMTSMNLKVEVVNGADYGVLSIGSLKGIMFIGIRAKTVGTKAPVQQKQSRKILLKQTANPATITVNDIHCTPNQWVFPILNIVLSTDYEVQTCKIDVDGLRDLTYTVEGFGNDSGRITHWTPDTSIEEMMVWVGEARSEFDNLGIGLVDKSITIQIEKLRKNLYGFVNPSYLQENARILHLTNDDKFEYIRSTIVHEYFHHAQAKTDLHTHLLYTNIYDSLTPIEAIFPNGMDQRKWLYESTAEWFSDHLYDKKNDYLNFNSVMESGEILKYGLIDTEKEEDEYKTMFFIKLLSEKCTNFEKEISHLFYGDFIVGSSTGIENTISFLSNPNTDCNFGTLLGEEKNTSLDTAMLYYQYATVEENDINLLDSINENKDIDYNFYKHPYQLLVKRFWSDTKLFLARTMISSNIGAYSTNSFGLYYDDIKDGNKTKIKLSIKTDKPLTVVGLRLDEDGKGIASRVENGAFNRIDGDFSFTTEAGVVKEYNFTDENVQGGLFITLLNATGEEVNIEELKLTEETKTKATLAFYYVYNCAGEVAGLKFKIYTTKNGASKLIHTEDFNGFYTENRTPDNNWIIKDGNLFKDANLYGNLGNDTIGGWQSKVLYEVDNKDEIASLINKSWTPEIYRYIEVNRSAGGGAGGVGAGGHVGIGWGNHGDNCSLPVIDYKVQTARMQTISVDQATIDKILKEF